MRGWLPPLPSSLLGSALAIHVVTVRTAGRLFADPGFLPILVQLQQGSRVRTVDGPRLYAPVSCSLAKVNMPVPLLS